MPSIASLVADIGTLQDAAADQERCLLELQDNLGRRIDNVRATFKRRMATFEAEHMAEVDAMQIELRDFIAAYLDRHRMTAGEPQPQRAMVRT